MRGAILAAAEPIFATHGSQHGSARAIARAAKVNPASITHHFGSKEGLLDHILVGRAEQLSGDCLARLDGLLASTQALTLEAVLDALVRPLVSFARDDTIGRTYGGMINQIAYRPEDHSCDLIRTVFATLEEWFAAAIQASVPTLCKADARWACRITILIGAQVLVASGELGGLRTELSAETDDEVYPAALCFLAAGIRALPDRQTSWLESLLGNAAAR